jgi:DMSO reductase family type II enzyme heme b subunit
MKPLALALAISSCAVATACSRAPAVNTAEVRAVRASGELPALDPQSAKWDAVLQHPARLMVQDVTEPRLTVPGVDLVNVRAMHDGTTIVFRLEWTDAAPDLIPDVGRGSDAAAIQLPLQPGANVPDAAMGEKGKGVQIAYWKSVWQDDASREPARKDRVAALHPNATTDHYPAEAGGAAREEMERRYAPARAAGNPMLTARNGPVQEIIAEGFGGATPAPAQKAGGRGVWANGKWVTTIARPLNEGDGAANLQPGQRTYVAFAVWDGAQRHTGARKMRSGWIPLVLE